MIVLASLSLAGPLGGAGSLSNCLKIPCDRIVADPTAGIMPSEALIAIGQDGRTDLTWTPLTVTIADGVFEGYLIAEDDGAGDLDVTGGTWFYGTALLDSDGVEDTIAGEVLYTVGASLEGELDVMFDQGGSAWSPTHTLSVGATYVTGGSAAAEIGGWELTTFRMSTTSGTPVYEGGGVPVDVDLAVGGIAYHMKQRTTSPVAVVVEETLDWFYGGYLYTASAAGSATRTGGSLTEATSFSDGVDAEATSSTANANSHEVKRIETSFAMADGSVRTATTRTRSGARVSVVNTQAIDLADGLSTTNSVGDPESLAVTAYPLAGVGTGSPFAVLQRYIGDQGGSTDTR